MVSGPVAYVNTNGGEAAYTYTFAGGDARALVECGPSVQVVSIRIIQQTASSATLGFTAIPGTGSSLSISHAAAAGRGPVGPALP
jgi:hypothetical protein